MVDEDEQAWLKYPQHRKWFNKLYVADVFGYKCGPAGIPVPDPGFYVVRPIYNLAGMGVGAKVIYLHPKDIDKIPPGYFWVEYFSKAPHYSVDYVRKDNEFVQINCYVGINNSDNLSVFNNWTRSNYVFHLPPILKDLDVPLLNIEAIGNKIFEVHLRNGFDHMMQYEKIYPVFEKPNGVTFHSCPDITKHHYIDDEADGNGYLQNRRVGYYVTK